MRGAAAWPGLLWLLGWRRRAAAARRAPPSRSGGRGDLDRTWLQQVKFTYLSLGAFTKELMFKNVSRPKTPGRKQKYAKHAVKSTTSESLGKRRHYLETKALKDQGAKSPKIPDKAQQTSSDEEVEGKLRLATRKTLYLRPMQLPPTQCILPPVPQAAAENVLPSSSPEKKESLQSASDTTP